MNEGGWHRTGKGQLKMRSNSHDKQEVDARASGKNQESTMNRAEPSTSTERYHEWKSKCDKTVSRNGTGETEGKINFQPLVFETWKTRDQQFLLSRGLVLTWMGLLVESFSPPATFSLSPTVRITSWFGKLMPCLQWDSTGRLGSSGLDTKKHPSSSPTPDPSPTVLWGPLRIDKVVP